MHVDVGIEEGYVRFDVAGKLDSASAPEFEEAVIGLMQENPKDALFHLEELTYISSAGLRVFLRAAKIGEGLNKRVVLSSLQPMVKEVFNLAGFSRIFTVAASLEDALALIQKGA
jgi:anti-sigma B factor antagonist